MERAVFLFVWCCLPLQGLEATPPEGLGDEFVRGVVDDVALLSYTPGRR